MAKYSDIVKAMQTGYDYTDPTPRGAFVKKQTPTKKKKGMSSFETAFAQARKSKGAGELFSHGGKVYTTWYKDEAPKGWKPDMAAYRAGKSQPRMSAPSAPSAPGAPKKTAPPMAATPAAPAPTKPSAQVGEGGGMGPKSKLGYMLAGAAVGAAGVSAAKLWTKMEKGPSPKVGVESKGRGAYGRKYGTVGDRGVAKGQPKPRGLVRPRSSVGGGTKVPVGVPRAATPKLLAERASDWMPNRKLTAPEGARTGTNEMFGRPLAKWKKLTEAGKKTVVGRAAKAWEAVKPEELPKKPAVVAKYEAAQRPQGNRLGVPGQSNVPKGATVVGEMTRATKAPPKGAMVIDEAAVKARKAFRPTEAQKAPAKPSGITVIQEKRPVLKDPSKAAPAKKAPAKAAAGTKYYPPIEKGSKLEKGKVVPPPKAAAQAPRTIESMEKELANLKAKAAGAKAAAPAKAPAPVPKTTVAQDLEAQLAKVKAERDAFKKAQAAAPKPPPKPKSPKTQQVKAAKEARKAARAVKGKESVADFLARGGKVKKVATPDSEQIIREYFSKQRTKARNLARKAKGGTALGIVATAIDLPRVIPAAKKHAAKPGSWISRFTSFAEEATGTKVPRDVRKDLGNQI